jgi:hypothetical protein
MRELICVIGPGFDEQAEQRAGHTVVKDRRFCGLTLPGCSRGAHLIAPGAAGSRTPRGSGRSGVPAIATGISWSRTKKRDCVRNDTP